MAVQVDIVVLTNENATEMISLTPGGPTNCCRVLVFFCSNFAQFFTFKFLSKHGELCLGGTEKKINVTIGQIMHTS